MIFHLLQNLKMILCYILAYGLSVTISGALKAWVAKKAGDRTADYAGFLTLDPLVHVDLLGVVSVILTGFGWGSEVPVDLYNIGYPLRDLKILLVYYTQTITHILLTSVAILLIAGLEITQVMYIGQTTLGPIAKIVLQSLITVNIFLAMLRFIQSSIDLICTHLIEQDPAAALYIRLGSLVVTLIILLLVGTQMQMFFANVSSSLALLFLRLIG